MVRAKVLSFSTTVPPGLETTPATSMARPSVSASPPGAVKLPSVAIKLPAVFNVALPTTPVSVAAVSGATWVAAPVVCRSSVAMADTSVAAATMKLPARVVPSTAPNRNVVVAMVKLPGMNPSVPTALTPPSASALAPVSGASSITPAGADIEPPATPAVSASVRSEIVPPELAVSVPGVPALPSATLGAASLTLVPLTDAITVTSTLSSKETLPPPALATTPDIANATPSLIVRPPAAVVVNAPSAPI